MRKFHDVCQDEAGNIVAGAELYVRDQGDNSLCTLYSDDGSTTTANPVVSGSDGYWSFYTADNTLKLEVYIDGELEKTVEQYQHFDLDNISAAAWTILDDATVGDIRTTLGVGTGDSPQFTAINLGHASDTTIARSGAGDVTIEGNAIYRAGGTDVPVADGGTGASTAAGARTNLGLGTIATFDETTAAQYRSNTADKALSTDTVWSAADYVALTPGVNVAVDMSTGFNFSLAMGGNYTLDNPTNTKNGQTGAIVITQDGTGSRTLAFGTNWHFAGGTDGVLSTAASSVDILFYQVISSTSIYATLVKAIA